MRAIRLLPYIFLQAFAETPYDAMITKSEPVFLILSILMTTPGVEPVLPPVAIKSISLLSLTIVEYAGGGKNHDFVVPLPASFGHTAARDGIRKKKGARAKAGSHS